MTYSGLCSSIVFGNLLWEIAKTSANNLAEFVLGFYRSILS